jgi:hypothetical protein
MGGRYGLLRDDDAPGGCLPLPIIAAETALAAIDAAIAAAAFVQVRRFNLVSRVLLSMLADWICDWLTGQPVRIWPFGGT